MTALAVTRDYLGRGAALADLIADQVAATASLDMQNTGDLVLFIKNGSGGNVVATLVGQYDRQGNVVANKAQTIADGKTAALFFFNAEDWNNAGIAQVTLDVITAVTVSLYRFRKI